METLKHYFVGHGPKIPIIFENQFNLHIGDPSKNIHNYTNDSSFKNISKLNSRFCELTGLYWIWKNSTINDEEYISFNHYRRWFDPKSINKIISQNQLNQIDFILPNVYKVPYSLEKQFNINHIPESWNYVYSVLNNNLDDTFLRKPEDFFQKTNVLFPYNMFVTNKKMLNELCSWLFKILFELNDQINYDSLLTQHRFIGFISERLMTYYFLNKKDIKHKECYVNGKNPRKRVNQIISNQISNSCFHLLWKNNLVNT